MRAWILQSAIASLVVALLLGGGCTEPPLGYTLAGRTQDLPGLAYDAAGLTDSGLTPAGLPGLCVPQGAICHQDLECCDSYVSDAGKGCNTTVGACGGLIAGAPGPACAPDGVVCEHSSDCCDGYCGISMGSGSGSGASGAPTQQSSLGVCGATPSPVCAPQGILCHETAQCCNPAMDGGTSTGISCEPYAGLGSEKVCGALAGFKPLCVPYGVTCLLPTDCCTKVCTLNIDNQMVCDIPPP